MLNVIIDLPMSGQKNMQKDEELFAQAERDKLPITLRIYQWQPQCISLGYAQDPDELLNIPECKEMGWDIVKRITGGGIVFHNIEEITYSFFIANDHPLLPKGIIPSCNFLSEIIIKTLHAIGITSAELAHRANLSFDPDNPVPDICFARPTKYEVVVNGKKIVGSAQKRGRKTLLQHGSICISRSMNIEKCLKVPCPDNSIGVKDILGERFSGRVVMGRLLEQFNDVFYDHT